VTKFVISGGTPLTGEVSIGGMKNAALAIIPATLLCKGVCRIENVPKINDVTIMLGMIEKLGAKVRLVDDCVVEIDPTGVTGDAVPPYDMMRSIRASYYLLGAMLGRFGTAKVALPGGCNIGVRAIDQHVKGFEALGANVEVKNGFVFADSPVGLSASHIYLDIASVGATINIILAAALTPGLTIIESAAKEPHIVDVANFLNSMGADIMGAGTDVIKIRGVETLAGGTYSIIPDQIEAGTYIAAIAATGGNALIKNIIPKHLECMTAKFSEMGVEFEEFDDAIRVSANGRFKKTNIKTLPYPGFPTDMQPQAVVLLCLSDGTSIVTESIFDNRFRYVTELSRMGANISVDGRVAVVEGVPKLTGAPIKALDLRAGAALVVAALAANGISEIEDIHHIERGYEMLVEKLRGLGANIARVSTPDAEELPKVL